MLVKLMCMHCQSEIIKINARHEFYSATPRFDNPVDNPWTFFKPRRLTDAIITSRS